MARTAAAAQDDAKPTEIDYTGYIQLDALGVAIALANGPKTYDNADLNEIVGSAIERLPNNNKARVSVVLIDEIDKAPRDVPNDLLREIEDMVGGIPELGPDVELPQPDFQFRPIVIITTNDERALPDAFLRRCCFLHIPFPEPDDLKKIIQTRLGLAWSERSLSGAAIRLIYELREDETRLQKKPTTAELIDFILELRQLGCPDTLDFLATDDPKIFDTAITAASSVFAKSKEDKSRVETAFKKLGK